MTIVTDEINEAINSLSLSESEFKKLPDSEAKVLYYELLDKFVEGGDRRWWWESFRNELALRVYDDTNSYEGLLSIVPNPKDKVWFIAEENLLPFYPIYEATTEAIVKIIGECYAFEYYLVPKSKNWLLCETHYNSIIGVGEIIVN